MIRRDVKLSLIFTSLWEDSKLKCVPEEFPDKVQSKGSCDVSETRWRTMLSSLRDIRIARRMSLRELSKKVGVHSTHLSRMEKCESHPNVVLAFRWSNALRIDFGQLYHAARESGDEGS